MCRYYDVCYYGDNEVDGKQFSLYLDYADRVDW